MGVTAWLFAECSMCRKMWCVMQVPDLQLGPAARFANDSQLFYPVAALLESPIAEQSKAALQVLLIAHLPLPCKLACQNLLILIAMQLLEPIDLLCRCAVKLELRSTAHASHSVLASCAQ